MLGAQRQLLDAHLIILRNDACWILFLITLFNLSDIPDRGIPYI